MDISVAVDYANGNSYGLPERYKFRFNPAKLYGFGGIITEWIFNDLFRKIY
jgi:hypothetical protein